MNNREWLQSQLEAVLGSDHVYFQPPESVKLVYPCIVYERNDIDKVMASDDVYIKDESYTVTLITKDPDSPLIDELLGLRYCSYDRHFVSDNLNHEIFNIYIRRI